MNIRPRVSIKATAHLDESEQFIVSALPSKFLPDRRVKVATVEVDFDDDITAVVTGLFVKQDGTVGLRKAVWEPVDISDVPKEIIVELRKTLASEARAACDEAEAVYAAVSA
jgi:hypothetical protein